MGLFFFYLKKGHVANSCSYFICTNMTQDFLVCLLIIACGCVVKEKQIISASIKDLTTSLIVCVG